MEINGTGKAVLYLPVLLLIMILDSEFETINLHLSMENERNYCITKDDEIIYSLSHKQLQEMRECIGLFLQKEREPIVSVDDDDDENLKIAIRKNIEYSADTNEFKAFYDVCTEEGDLTYMSYKQVKQLSDLLLDFLSKYGEHDHIMGNFCEESESETQNISPIGIHEDDEATLRRPVFRANALIGKYIFQQLGEKVPKVSYSLYSNERILNDLTHRQLLKFYQDLSLFA